MEADNYWSIDSILAEELNVKVSLIEGAENYGNMGEENKDHLEPGDKLEMPLWLSKVLYIAK